MGLNMSKPFTNEQLNNLVKQTLLANKVIFVWYFHFDFKNATAKEHAARGLCQRLITMRANVMNIFDAYRPGREGIPSSKEMVDLTINFQSFIFHLYGCLDNLAWIWASESGFEYKRPSEITFSLNKNGSVLLKTLSDDFQQFWKSKSRIIKHIENFRHALAHRIPLYVPPYIPKEGHIEECNQINEEMQQASLKYDLELFDKLLKKLEKIAFFEPICAHSVLENSQMVSVWLECISGLDFISTICKKISEEIRNRDNTDTTELDKKISAMLEDKSLFNIV